MLTDPRVVQALMLLQQVFEEQRAGAGGAVLPSGELGANLRFEELTSSTDLLSLWLPSQFSMGGHWDDYFGGVHMADSRQQAWLAVAHAPAPAPATTPAAHRLATDVLTRSEPLLPLSEPGAVLADDQLAPEADAAAVDALYHFVRSLEKGDFSSARDCFTSEFRCVLDEVEYDRRSLVDWFRRELDHLGHPLTQISLRNIPTAIAHPYGVIFECALQLDGVGPIAESRVLERIILMSEDAPGAWKIAAFGSPTRSAEST